MKKTNLLLIVLGTMILTSHIAIAQSNQPQIIQSSAGNPETFQYEFQGLPISGPGAFYSHLWWFGDNQFSFSDTPKNIFPRIGTYTVFAAPTENYGTGGPPPMTAISNPNSGAPINARILQPNNSIHVQHYRNAVPDDTMYLIITYALPDDVDEGRAHNGSLVLDVDPATSILGSYITDHPEFHPGREIFDQVDTWNFTDLKDNVERSILVPIAITSTQQEVVTFRVTLNIDKYELPQTFGVSHYSLTIPVAESHDPNFMIEESTAISECDFGGKPINYDIHFQNVGDTTTKFVSVTCYLDPKLNFNSVSEIVLPKEYGNASITRSETNGGYEPGAGAIYEVNHQKNQIIFEFNDLVLRTTQDPMCKDLNLTRSSVSFKIRVKPNYRFGPAVSGQANIVFDSNDPIETNLVETVCADPLSPQNGGGFYTVNQTIEVKELAKPQKGKLKRP